MGGLTRRDEGMRQAAASVASCSVAPRSLSARRPWEPTTTIGCSRSAQLRERPASLRLLQAPSGGSLWASREPTSSVASPRDAVCDFFKGAGDAAVGDLHREQQRHAGGDPERCHQLAQRLDAQCRLVEQQQRPRYSIMARSPRVLRGLASARPPSRIPSRGRHTRAAARRGSPARRRPGSRGQRRQQPEHRVPGRAVEVPGRLVREDQLRLPDERPRDRRGAAARRRRARSGV